jgi:uncharacterized protein (DUF1015 family)
MLNPMADVQPFRALRYAQGLDLSKAICPPFDTISPEQQDRLYDRSPYNAVRIELAKDDGGSRYENAARSLQEFIARGTLVRDGEPAFYLHRHTFTAAGKQHTRRVLFARLRVTPWSDGEVLPHEQTFGAPKEDRIQNMRATGINASPVFMVYRDARRAIAGILADRAQAPFAEFPGDGGDHHSLSLITGETAAALQTALVGEQLYIADGHHRYETALAYREEVRAGSSDWTGDDPANFALVALASAADPGLVVLPIHRVTRAGDRWDDVRSRLTPMFNIAPVEGSILQAVAATGPAPAFGLVARDTEANLLLTVKDAVALDAALPADHSAAWKSLDYSIANQAIMQACLGLSSEQMKEYKTVQFTADPEEAESAVRSGDARYAVLMNPVPVHRVLELADAGERMPQKSTFFYPKVPTGLVFNQVTAD